MFLPRGPYRRSARIRTWRWTLSSFGLPKTGQRRCRLTGQFRLRSGQVADEYFDKYLFEADPVLLGRMVSRMVDLMPADTDMLGGLELGGAPWQSF